MDKWLLTRTLMSIHDYLASIKKTQLLSFASYPQSECTMLTLHVQPHPLTLEKRHYRKTRFRQSSPPHDEEMELRFLMSVEVFENMQTVLRDSDEKQKQDNLVS